MGHAVGAAAIGRFVDLYNRQVYFDLYAEADTALAVVEVDHLVSLLGITPGQSVLDVGCGCGRHAIELARRGFRVTGIDLTPKQIEAARERARPAGVDARFVLGDVRTMDFNQEFDVAVNLFTSFGFFETEADHLEMLKRIARAVAPGGQFLMETWNREQVIRTFQERELEGGPQGARVEKRWEFDALAGRINWANTVTFPHGRPERWSHSVRAYTLVELRHLHERVGLQLERVFGNWRGEDLQLDSEQLITVARKL